MHPEAPIPPKGRALKPTCSMQRPDTMAPERVPAATAASSASVAPNR